MTTPHRQPRGHTSASALWFRLLRGSALAGLAACHACAALPPNQAPILALPRPAVSPPPARWFESDGTYVGPKIAGGTPVLLSGRRLLVGDDGVVHPEVVRCAEPLLQLVVVPVPRGAPVLVGRGEHGVYRFDEPLGASDLSRDYT